MERLRLDRTALMQKVYSTILDYDKHGYTSHVLWDWACDTSKFLNWLIGYENAEEPFYIFIRRCGCEAGTLDYVSKRCAAFGEPILRIRIERESNIGVNYTITIGF